MDKESEIISTIKTRKSAYIDQVMYGEIYRILQFAGRSKVIKGKRR